MQVHEILGGPIPRARGFFPTKKSFAGSSLGRSCKPDCLRLFSLNQSAPRRCPLPHRCCACLSSAARPAAPAPTPTPEALPAAVVVEPGTAVVAPAVPSLCPVAAPPPPPPPNPPKIPDLRAPLDVAEPGAANEEGTAGPLPRRLMSSWGGARRERTSPGGGAPPDDEGQIWAAHGHFFFLKQLGGISSLFWKGGRISTRTRDSRQRGNSRHARRPSP